MTIVASSESEAVTVRLAPSWWGMLRNDRFAMAAAVWLLAMVFCVILGPLLLGAVANGVNLRGRNLPPGLDNGWTMLLGGDALGRSVLARLIVAAQNTLLLASSAVCVALVAGGSLGLIAGYFGGWIGTLIMRIADLIQSFPSMLLALTVLFILQPNVGNLIIVLAIARTPIYLRVTRAEVLEIRERVFVDAARSIGAGQLHILRRHIIPVVAPTLLTITTVDFAAVMLMESSLSFLGIGIQPPEITWGLMVAQGREYLAQAWWLAIFPGIAIMLTTLSANILSAWLRLASDPVQRWRLANKRKAGK
jgi:peptide/nickel transport system permease protein